MISGADFHFTAGDHQCDGHKAQKDRKITEDTRQGLHDKLTKLFPEIEIRDDLDDPLAVIIVLPEGLLEL